MIIFTILYTVKWNCWTFWEPYCKSKKIHATHVIRTIFYLQHSKFFELRYMISISWIPYDRVIKFTSPTISDKIFRTKDVKELSWMSHRVIRFWFLLNFLFILAFFDILASLSISHIFQVALQADQILLLRHSQNNYQMWLNKLSLMCEELSHQIINTSGVNQAVFFLKENTKSG